MPVKVLALDLERTLISDAMSGVPRPGLFDFLAFRLERFERVVFFTSVEESDAREVLEELTRSGHVPPGFVEDLEYVQWEGEHKDLGFVRAASPADILLIDDDIGWIRPDQQDRWIRIAAWDGGADSELARVRSFLEDTLTERQRPLPNQND